MSSKELVWVALLVFCVAVILLCGCEDSGSVHKTISISETWYERNAIELQGDRIPSPQAGPWTHITDVVAPAGGRIVVLDRGLGGAFLADRSDTPPVQFVGFGQGVGELTSTQTAFVTRDGFCVTDGGVARVLEFDRDGSYVGEWHQGRILEDMVAVEAGYVATPMPPPDTIPDTFALGLAQDGDTVTSTLPYPAELREGDLADVVPSLHRWRVAAGDAGLYFVAAGLPVLVRAPLDLSSMVLYFVHDELEARIRDFSKPGLNLYNDIDVDESGNVFVARSGAWGLRADGEWAYRVDMYDPELNPVAVLIVENHPNRISAYNGRLIVGSLATPNGEWMLQSYEYCPEAVE